MVDMSSISPLASKGFAERVLERLSVHVVDS
jgi:3-hydroxyisobutyrate dehydrogenase-like beta-hydroxyacid dehydrogenase